MAFGVPLAIAVALGHAHEGAVATQGAFAAVYARDEPYRRRLAVMVGVGLALTLVVSAGTLVSSLPVAIAVGAGLVAGLGSLLGSAWDVGRPREFILVLAFLAATQYPGGADDVPLRAALVLGGAATVTAIAMAGALRRPRGPEERALQALWGRIADLLDAVGGPGAAEARHDALVAVEEARTVLVRAGHRRGDGDRLFGIALGSEGVLDAALGLVLRDSPSLDPGWAAAARTIRDSVRDPAAARDLGLPAEPPAAVHGDRFARMMARAVAAADPAMALQSTLVPFGRKRRRPPLSALRRVLHPGSLVLPTAARTGIAVAAGTAIGLTMDPQRGIWVGLTTAAVLQASNVTLTAQRTFQRAGGTVLGVGLAALVLAFDPAAGVIVLALMLFQTLMQTTIQSAYGVATFFATPLALLIVDLGRPGTPAGSLVGARIVDTLIGCAVGLLARRLLWPRTAATRLAAAQGAAIEAARGVLHAALTRSEQQSGHRVRRSRRSLHTALLNLRAVQQDAVGDLLFSGHVADERWRTTSAVERLSYAAMAVGAPEDRVLPARAELPRLDAALGALAAIAEGHRPAAFVPVPPIEGHPATHRALLELRDVLRGEDRGAAQAG
ncbi:FUSC family protein [Patulibacter minatonensis]|uniref:FUSC family protein n=1 Tax=Patulibacter minatonensis TaxID=298163 RepID=UPI000479187C|nr:FUSC family protein [Patulibacter minatonensis]